MHSTMLSGSLGTRIIQKNKEKTSVPPCFALEAPMRSHTRKTRKARLHVNGGVLIPQRGTFWLPRVNAMKRLSTSGNAPGETRDNKSNKLYTDGLRVSRALRAPSAPFGRKSPRPFFFPACPPGSPPCCGPGRSRRRHRTPCFTWHPTADKARERIRHRNSKGVLQSQETPCREIFERFARG